MIACLNFILDSFITLENITVSRFAYLSSIVLLLTLCLLVFLLFVLISLEFPCVCALVSVYILLNFLLDLFCITNSNEKFKHKSILTFI